MQSSVNGGQTPAPTIRSLTPFAPAKQSCIIYYVRPRETASERESVRAVRSVRETMRRRVCVTGEDETLSVCHR